MLIPNSRDLQILWEQQKKRGKLWIRNCDKLMKKVKVQYKDTVAMINTLRATLNSQRKMLAEINNVNDDELDDDDDDSDFQSDDEA